MPVDAALVVPNTTLDALLGRTLHLDVVPGAVLVLQIDIQPDPMSQVRIRQVLLLADVNDLRNGPLQQCLQEQFAETHILHHFPKKEVVRKAQCLQGFPCFCCHLVSSCLIILYPNVRLSCKMVPAFLLPPEDCFSQIGVHIVICEDCLFHSWATTGKPRTSKSFRGTRQFFEPSQQQALAGLTDQTSVLEQNWPAAKLLAKEILSATFLR